MKGYYRNQLKELIKESRVYLNKYEYIDMFYPAMIILVFTMILIGLNCLGILHMW